MGTIQVYIGTLEYIKIPAASSGVFTGNTMIGKSPSPPFSKGGILRYDSGQASMVPPSQSIGE